MPRSSWPIENRIHDILHVMQDLCYGLHVMVGDFLSFIFSGFVCKAMKWWLKR